MSKHAPHGQTLKKVQALAAQGLTAKEIAQRLGISKTRVGELKQQHGIAMRNRYDRVHERNAVVRRLVQEGLAVAEVAQRLQVSQRVVRLATADLSTHKQRCAQMLTQVEHLAARGKTVKEIQGALGWKAAASVYAYCKRHGIAVNYVQPGHGEGDGK